MRLQGEYLPLPLETINRLRHWPAHRWVAFIRLYELCWLSPGGRLAIPVVGDGDALSDPVDDAETLLEIGQMIGLDSTDEVRRVLAEFDVVKFSDDDRKRFSVSAETVSETSFRNEKQFSESVSETVSESGNLFQKDVSENGNSFLKPFQKEETFFSSVVRPTHYVAHRFISPTLQKLTQTSEARALAGAKGGRARAANDGVGGSNTKLKNEPSSKTKAKRKQNEANASNNKGKGKGKGKGNYLFAAQIDARAQPIADSENSESEISEESVDAKLEQASVRDLPIADRKRFLEWYACYNRRCSKRAAAIAYRSALSRVESAVGDRDAAHAYLVSRTRALMDTPRGRQEPGTSYLPNPSTFLNQTAYEDDPADSQTWGVRANTKDAKPKKSCVLDEALDNPF